MKKLARVSFINSLLILLSITTSIFAAQESKTLLPVDQEAETFLKEVSVDNGVTIFTYTEIERSKLWYDEQLNSIIATMPSTYKDNNGVSNREWYLCKSIDGNGEHDKNDILRFCKTKEITHIIPKHEYGKEKRYDFVIDLSDRIFLGLKMEDLKNLILSNVSKKAKH